jgi:Trk K+ transport system NAD-binding subunit
LELDEPVRAFVFLVSPERQLGPHLRSVAQIVTTIDAPDFLERWIACQSEQEMRALLLRDERFMQLTVHKDGTGAELLGSRLRDPNFPAGVLVALVHRDDSSFVPTGDEIIQEGDRLTIIGNPGTVESLRHRFAEEPKSDQN